MGRAPPLPLGNCAVAQRVPPRPTPAGTRPKVGVKASFFGEGVRAPCHPGGRLGQCKSSPPLISNFPADFSPLPLQRGWGGGRERQRSSPPAFLLARKKNEIIMGWVWCFFSPQRVNPRTLKTPPPRRVAALGPLLPAEPFSPFSKVLFSLAPPNSPRSSILRVVRFISFFPKLLQAQKTLISLLFHCYNDYY